VVLPHLEAAEVVTDPFVRTNLRLVDRREVADRDAVVTAVCERGDKTLLYVGTRAAAVETASRLREARNGHVAYYHAGLPLRVREVLEQLFADGKIMVLVASDGFTADAAPGDLRQVVVAGLPAHRGDLKEIVGSAGLDGRQATVTLAYKKNDLRAVEGLVAEQHPPREMLAALYRVVRAEVDRSGAATWPDDTLTTALQSVGIAPKTAGIGLDILAEAGVIQREYDGDRWRISLGGSDRKDLATSLRFAEGRREAEALDALKTFAFGPLTEILQAVAGPGAVRRGSAETTDSRP
jgi:superfamily II DNA/RNA helicase